MLCHCSRQEQLKLHQFIGAGDCEAGSMMLRLLLLACAASAGATFILPHTQFASSRSSVVAPRQLLMRLADDSSLEGRMAAAARVVSEVSGVVARVLNDGTIEFAREQSASRDQSSPKVLPSLGQPQQQPRPAAVPPPAVPPPTVPPQQAPSIKSSAANARAALAAVMTDTRRKKLQERMLSPESVSELLQSPDENATLVDVRTLTDQEAGTSLVGAETFPLDGLLEGLADTPPFGGGWPKSGMKYFAVPKSKVVILACEDGEKSLIALDVLYSRYERIHCIEGGAKACKSAGLLV